MTKLKDLTGQTFGRFKVISREKNNKDNKAMWLCECSCKNKTQKIFTGYQLSSGKATDCGCVKKEIRESKFIGKTFGRWTVLKRDDTDNNRDKWICECSCDLKTIRSVRAENLLDQTSQSCGCLNRENSINSGHNPTGERYNRLVVIGLHSKNIKGTSLWECKCDCGNYTKATYGNLVSGNVQSCGCLKDEVICKHEFNTYVIEGDIVKCYTNNMKEFIIDLQDYEKIKDYYWFVTNPTNYVCTKIIRDKIVNTAFLHRFLLNPKTEEIVDHINRNPLNNTRVNLRIVTRSQNNINTKMKKNNTSGVVGVHWDKRKDKWVARIGIDKKRIHLGYFNNIDDAIECRLNAEKVYHKEFAPIERRSDYIASIHIDMSTDLNI